MELAAWFLPTLAFCFSTDFLSIPWSVLSTFQELVTAFNLIHYELSVALEIQIHLFLAVAVSCC